MPSERVLIVGAGPAGSIIAFWLARFNYEVVVVERSHAGQKLGQGVEIEKPAIEVVQAMDIMDRLRAVMTGEKGFELMNEKSQSYGVVSSGGFSPTGALEIMRGDLTEVLYRTADESPHVTFHFRTIVQNIEQTADKVTVELEDRANSTTRHETFDVVIGADGARSRTRNLVMTAPDEVDCMHSIDAFVAYFSIPKAPGDWPNSRLCHFGDNRIVWLRPIGEDSEETSAYLLLNHGDVTSLQKANMSGDRTKQKEAFAEIFAGLGWETPRVIKEMMSARNFYSDELMQVKLPRWSRGRVVLVGDAAWAPTPLTGSGNHLALIGAWVLAQELGRHHNDPTAAFAAYDSRLRKYVTDAQQIPLNGRGPQVFNPRPLWGVSLVRFVYFCFIRLLAFSRFTGLSKLFPEAGEDHEPFDLQIGDEKVVRKEKS